MMTLQIQMILGVILMIALAAIINMIRKKSLDLKYALSWLIVIVLLLIIDIFPVLMITVSQMLGIWSPVNMIFFLGFCFSLVIIFTLTVALSRMSARVRKMTQVIALNEKNIEKLLKEVKRADEENHSNGM